MALPFEEKEYLTNYENIEERVFVVRIFNAFTNILFK